MSISLVVTYRNTRLRELCQLVWWLRTEIQD